jgi:serine/threonine-protein kinase TTK/MPS1
VDFGNYDELEPQSAVDSSPPRVHHKRRDSATLVPPSLSNNQDLGSSQNSQKGSPTQTQVVTSTARHRRSPTPPEASSNHSEKPRNELRSVKTWGAGHEEEDDREKAAGNGRERENHRGHSRSGGDRPSTAQFPRDGFFNGSRQIVVRPLPFPHSHLILTRRKVNGKVYVRLDLLGRGGSSRVYRVLTKDNEIYAVKKVALDKSSEDEFNGYKNEISLLRRLEGNDRIIKLFDAEIRDEAKGTLLLVMECGEIDLARLLQQQQTVSVDMVWIRYYWKQVRLCEDAYAQTR